MGGKLLAQVAGQVGDDAQLFPKLGWDIEVLESQLRVQQALDAAARGDRGKTPDGIGVFIEDARRDLPAAF